MTTNNYDDNDMDYDTFASMVLDEITMHEELEPLHDSLLSFALSINNFDPNNIKSYYAIRCSLDNNFTKIMSIISSKQEQNKTGDASFDDLCDALHEAGVNADYDFTDTLMKEFRDNTAMQANAVINIAARIAICNNISFILPYINSGVVNIMSPGEALRFCKIEDVSSVKAFKLARRYGFFDKASYDDIQNIMNDYFEDELYNDALEAFDEYSDTNKKAVSKLSNDFIDAMLYAAGSLAFTNNSENFLLESFDAIMQAVEPGKRNKFISDASKILDNHTIASNEYTSMLNDYGITGLLDDMLANANTNNTASTNDDTNTDSETSTIESSSETSTSMTGDNDTDATDSSNKDSSETKTSDTTNSANSGNTASSGNDADMGAGTYTTDNSHNDSSID